MDWIERLLGFSPDAGDGSLEMLVMVIIAVAILMVVWWVCRAGRVAQQKAV